MMTLQQPALAPDQAVHEQFLALLCQDEQLLRAEFEDLIAATWPTRSRRQPPPGSAASPAQLPRGRGSQPAPQPPGRREPRAQARQRAPPERSERWLMCPAAAAALRQPRPPPERADPHRTHQARVTGSWTGH